VGLKSSEVIEALGLEPLPIEGGMFRRVYADDYSSAIYFLVTPEDFSAFHKLTSVEVWHHYAGDPAELVLLNPDGSVTREVLGTDFTRNERPLSVAPVNTWMAARTLGEWTLFGTTMAPGYTPDMYEHGDRKSLLKAYPQAAEPINSLTRE